MRPAAISVILVALVLCVVFGDGSRAALAEAPDPPPRGTSLSDPRIRFTVSAKPYAVLRRGPLEAVVVDNRAVDDAVLPGHRAGYHGLGALKHARQPRNLFVPSYAGLNFEHIHDGTTRDTQILFEPRHASMELRVIDDRTAELYQAPTPHWGLESCQRYELIGNGTIELTVECVLHPRPNRPRYLGLFWASYIHTPESLDIHFMGCPADEPQQVPAWVRAVTPRHGELATHVGLDDERDFPHEAAFPLSLVFNRSRYRYAESWYFGLCRGMAFAQIFRDQDQARLSQSPSGGGAGCPAWDFQWLIPDCQVGQRYQRVMRALYLPVEVGAGETTVGEAVRAAVQPWRQGWSGPSAPSSDDLLAPLFRPPTEWAGRFGSYRSPLRFSDDTRVTAAADWPRRRLEILRQWTDLMGPWPPLLDHPNWEVLAETNRVGLHHQRVRLQTAPGQRSEGWLLRPGGSGPFPAVLVVYYEPETSVGLGQEAHRDFGLGLARRGFVTLSIGTPGGDARQPDLGSATCQPLSFHAYVAANCWNALAHLPEVDPARIGIVGHSYGGKWALFAAALWEPFAAVAVSDPGIVFDETRPNVNYWEPWYLGMDPGQPRRRPGIPSPANPRTGAYRLMIETGRDLHELHALIASRPFLVSGGAEDPPERWTALNHALEINRLLGVTNRVGLSHRPGHTPTAESNDQLYAFFVHFLGNRGARPGAGRERPRSQER